MRNAQRYLVTAVLFLPLLGGCSEPADDNPPNTHVKRIEQDSEDVVVLPAISEYEAQGQEYTREVKHVRIFTPFGDSPGSTIGKVEPFDASTGKTPSVDMNGIAVGSGGGGSFLGGGMKGGWLAQLWSDWIVPALWIYGGLVGVGFVLMMFPATSWIGGGLLRLLVGAIPGVGSAVERIIASRQLNTADRQFAQVVQGVASYAEAQPEAKAALYAKLAAVQDTDTQAKVKAVKGA